MPDRLDDRLVIDACDGHMDGDPVRARRNIEGLLDAIAFVQALDDIAAVVEHETVAPLAIVALFQDQRAVVGLDHMGLVAVHDAGLALVVHQPDVIGIDLHGLALSILQLREATCHGRRQDDLVAATVFCDIRRTSRFLALELYRTGARAAFHLGHIKDDLLRAGRAIRVRHRDGEVFLALRPGLELLVFFTERVHHIGVLTGLGIDGQVAEFSLDGLQTVLGRSSRISIIHAVAQIPLDIVHIMTDGRALHRVPVLDLDRMFCRNGLPVRSPELQGRSIVHPVDGDGDAACDALSAGIARDRKVFLHGRMGAILVQILQLVTAFFSQLIGVGQAAVFIACDGQGPVLTLGLPGTVACCQINRLPAPGSDARDMLFIPGIRVRDRDRLDVDGVSGILRDGRRAAGDTGSIILPRDLEGQFLFFRDGIVFIKHHHGERGFTDIALPQMLRGLVVEDKGVFTGLLVQLQIAVFAGLRTHVAHGAIFTRDLDQVLEDAPLACRTAVRAVHVRSLYPARDGLGATVLLDACDRKAVIRDLQPCLPLIHRDARHFRGIVAALDGDLQRLVGSLSIALPRPLGMDGEIIIPDLSALQGIGRVTVVVQLVEILAGRRVEIERAVLSLHDLDVGIRAPGFLRELLADGILDLGPQLAEGRGGGHLPVLRRVDGVFHLIRPAVHRVIILGFQLARRDRTPVLGLVLRPGMHVGHDAGFHHRDHCRVAHEDRGRVLAGDGDGDVLHIPGALVVTHGHMEGQLFFLSFRQADDRFAFRIQIEGILAGGGIDLEGAELIAERRRHADAFGISPVQAPKIRIRQQAVGELVPRVGIFGADLPGNRNHALIQAQVRGVLDLRRIIGTVDGKLLRSRRLRRGAMLVTDIEVDRKVELHILAIRRQCRPGFIRIQQAQGILSRRRIERQFGYGHPVEGKGHRSSATPHRGRQCRIAYPAHLVHEIGESRIPGIDIAGRKLPFHGPGPIGHIFFGIELRLAWRRDRAPVVLAAHPVSVDVLWRRSRDLDGRTVVGAVDIDGGRMFAVRTVAVLVLDLERDIDAQVHVLRQTVQAILIRGKGISQLIIRAVLLQFERAQRDDLTVIDAGDGSLQRVDAVSGLGDGVGGVHHSRPIWRCHIQRLLDPQRQPLTNDQAVRIVGILLVEGDSYFLRTCIPAGKRTIRVCCSPLAAPNASFIHIQHRFRIVREHRLVVRAFDGDGDGLFRPGPPVVHDADHKGLGHALALAQCRDVIIALVELIGIVPVLVQGQGPVLRGGDVPAVTTPGDIHRAGPQIMAAAVLPHRGGGQRRIIARALQGELQSVVVSVRGFLPRAVFPVVIRGLHTAGEPDHGIGRTIGRAVGMQAVVRHRYFLAGGIEELFAVKDVQRRPVIGAGHRDRHFLAGPGAMLVPDEDGEGLRQRLAFIEVVEPVVLRPVTGRKIAALVQRVGIAAVRSDGQAAVLPPDGDIAAVSGKVDAIRGFGLAGLHTVDEFRAVVGILARGLVAVRERTVIPADLVSSRPVLAGRANELVIRPIDHGTVIMTAHAAFRDVQRAVIRSVTQLQTGLVVGPVDGDGDVGGNFLAEGIPDRDGKGLGQHLALGQLVDGIAVRIKSAGLELIGIGTVCMEGQRTVAGFIDGIAVRRSGDLLGRLRLGHGRRTVRFQLGIRGIHTEGEIPLVAKVNVRGIDPARKALCLVMAGDDIALPVDDIPRLCRRIAVTAVMVDAFFLEDEIILVRDDRERARAFHLDDDLPGVVSTMLIHHGDLKGLEMGVLGIELLDELAPAVDHIGPAAVRIDGQSTVVGRENGLGAAFRADMPRLRLMPCGRRGRMLHISIRMGTAGNKDGLVTARIGIDVPDIERSGKLGPARGVIGISGVALYGLEHRTVREDLPVAIPDLQRRLVIAARNGDGHGLQIPGAVLVLHIDGEGIRDGGPFRQGIDGGNVKGLAVKAGRPLHGFSLALQGIGPGAVAVQDQMAEAPFHGLAALHVAIRGILAQKDVCVRALRPFPAAVLALVTGHGTEPQLVPGVHVRAGHLAFQLLRALVIGVRAVVGLVLFLRTRSSHHLTVIGTPHAALDEPQLGIRIQRDLRLVVGTGDGERDLLLLPGALVVLHEDGEAFRDRGPFRQVVQRRLTVEVPVQPLLELFQAGVGRPVHRDREGQRYTVAVPVQRVGIGGRAVGRFRHDQLAVMPLGRDAGLAARGQSQAFGRRHAGTVRHGKVQDVAMIHVRSVDTARDRSGPCGIIVVGVVLFGLSGLVEGAVIGGRRIPAHTGLIQQAVRVSHGQRRSIIAARNGDGHGLQIPGAVLVLHIDGEGIRDGGPFRQGIDGGNVKGLAVKAGRPLHGFSLALQGIGPGAVAVQDQMAEAPFHGLAALHVAIRGILAQKDVCVRALRPFPAAVLALVTGHGTEPQLVPGVHVRAGHLAFQLLRALVIGVRAVVGLVLFLRTRSSHHLTVIGTPHAALDEPQLGIRIQRDLRLVVGPLDGHGERGLGLAALPVLHAHGEVLTHGLAQGQAVGIGVIVVQGIGDDTGVGIDGDDAILGDDAVAAVGKAVGQPPAVRIAGHHLPHDDRHTGGEDIALDLLAPVGLHTGFHQGHVVTVHSDDAADLGIEVLVRPAADLIVGPLHAIAKTDVQTPQMIDAVQQVAAAVFVIAAAARGAAAGGRTGGGHQVFAKGREEILPAALHPFHLEGGHIFLGIRGVEALQPDGRPIFKAQDKIVAIAGQRRRIRRKIEDEAPVRSAGDGLCGTSNRLGKTDIGHEGPPDKKSCNLSKKYENVKSPVPKGLGTGLGFARHARGASGVRQGEGIKKSCHAR